MLRLLLKRLMLAIWKWVDPSEEVIGKIYGTKAKLKDFLCTKQTLVDGVNKVKVKWGKKKDFSIEFTDEVCYLCGSLPNGSGFIFLSNNKNYNAEPRYFTVSRDALKEALRICELASKATCNGISIQPSGTAAERLADYLKLNGNYGS